MENELEIPDKWSFYHKQMYNKIISDALFEIGEKKKEIIWLINNYLPDYLDDYIVLHSKDCFEVYIKARRKFYFLYLKEGEEIKVYFHSIKSIKEVEAYIKDNNYAEVKICLGFFAQKYIIQYSKDNKEASDFFAKLI